MNILVTGCAGFIGSHLSEKLLNEGHSVVGVDNFDPFYSINLKKENLDLLLPRRQFTFIEGDLSDFAFFTYIPNNIDCVIHLAAKAGVRPSIQNPDQYITANIVVTENILRWMKGCGVSNMLFASSSSVYGNNTKVPFSENDNTDHPISPYAFTKKACELITYTYHVLYNFNIINLRFFTVYGPRQRPDLAIRKFIELIKAEEPITMYGQGNTGRDYTYISDTVDGIFKSLNYLLNNKCTYETINLGNSNPVQLSVLIDTIFNCLNKTPNIIYAPMQSGDVELTYADISKANRLLGYKPKITINEGIIHTINWLNKREL